jgi:hypothetical protein
MMPATQKAEPKVCPEVVLLSFGICMFLGMALNIWA